MADDIDTTSRDQHLERSGTSSNAAGTARDDAVGDNRPRWEQGRFARLSEPSLRAAALAMGLGLVWVALSRGRRRGATDLW
jgi:hypothetical protein